VSRADPPPDHARLHEALSREYEAHAPKCAAVQERALRVLIDGGSHTMRLDGPFPLRVARARGAYVWDEDGHRIVDFWQGHVANVLGHNPPCVTEALAAGFAAGNGLLHGFTDRLQVEVAEILCRQTGAERVRFTTSGSLATMYAILLARAFTGRRGVMKIGGGWHGAQPWGLKGVAFAGEGDAGFSGVETLGLPEAFTDEVIVTRFNDPEMLESQFRDAGDRLACFIVEPFVGAGGYIPADPAYLRLARALTERYGALLIHDEVISGFRFHPGDTGALYDVKPDLATFGKVIGGGMPLAAVAGRADVMAQAGKAEGCRVKFSGGTYAAHPASLLAAKTALTYLIGHTDTIYPRLSELGARVRRIARGAFTDAGIPALCTGGGNEVVPESPLSMLVFPRRNGLVLDSPDVIMNPDLVDVPLAGDILRLGLLLEDVHVCHGLGAVTTAHTDEDLARFDEACRTVAQRIKTDR